MQNISNSLVSNPVVFLTATLSSTVVSLPYDDSSTWIPEINPEYTCHSDISDWKDEAFNSSTDYDLQYTYEDRFQTIIEFSKKIFNKSKDLDSEYLDIVNENFWDLL